MVNIRDGTPVSYYLWYEFWHHLICYGGGGGGGWRVFSLKCERSAAAHHIHPTSCHLLSLYLPPHLQSSQGVAGIPVNTYILNNQLWDTAWRINVFWKANLQTITLFVNIFEDLLIEFCLFVEPFIWYCQIKPLTVHILVFVDKISEPLNSLNCAPVSYQMVFVCLCCSLIQPVFRPVFQLNYFNPCSSLVILVCVPACDLACVQVRVISIAQTLVWACVPVWFPECAPTCHQAYILERVPGQYMCSSLLYRVCSSLCPSLFSSLFWTPCSSWCYSMSSSLCSSLYSSMCFSLCPSLRSSQWLE